MKKWNAPELAALDINMTENGIPWPQKEEHKTVRGPITGWTYFEYDTVGVTDCGGNHGSDAGTKGGEQTSGNNDTDLPSGL